MQQLKSLSRRFQLSFNVLLSALSSLPLLHRLQRLEERTSRRFVFLLSRFALLTLLDGRLLQRLHGTDPTRLRKSQRRDLRLQRLNSVCFSGIHLCHQTGETDAELGEVALKDRLRRSDRLLNLGEFATCTNPTEPTTVCDAEPPPPVFSVL